MSLGKRLLIQPFQLWESARGFPVVLSDFFSFFAGLGRLSEDSAFAAVLAKCEDLVDVIPKAAGMFMPRLDVLLMRPTYTMEKTSRED